MLLTEKKKQNETVLGNPTAALIFGVREHKKNLQK